MSDKSGARTAPVAGVVLAIAPIVGAAIFAAWVRADLPLPVCAFHYWTGLPCATCGSVRMLRAALGGRLLEALAWNPLVFCGLAAIAPWAAVTGLRRAPGRAGRSLALSPRARLTLAAAVAVVANWLYLVLRGT